MRYWSFVFQGSDGLFTVQARVYPLAWPDDDVINDARTVDPPGELIQWNKEPIAGD